MKNVNNEMLLDYIDFTPDEFEELMQQPKMYSKEEERLKKIDNRFTGSHWRRCGLVILPQTSRRRNVANSCRKGDRYMTVATAPTACGMRRRVPAEE